MLNAELVKYSSADMAPTALFAAGDYAAAYWLPLAEAGDATAQNYIGTHHYLGLGVKRNLRQATQWFEQSARAGEVKLSITSA